MFLGGLPDEGASTAHPPVTNFDAVNVVTTTISPTDARERSRPYSLSVGFRVSRRCM